MPSFEPENKTIVCDLKNSFGDSMDYFLFGVHSSADFSQAMDFFIRNFHANMVHLEDFSVEGHPLNAKFPMAYALFDLCGFADDQPENLMDFLSVVLFQNRAKSFDKPQEKKNPDSYDMFSEEPELESNDLTCFALNKNGLCLQNWALADVDYLVIIFSKKDRDAVDFANYFNTFPINKANLTSFIRFDSPQLTKKILPQIYFVRSISDYAQREIAKDLEMSDLCTHHRSLISLDNNNKSKFVI